jgi:hypothetical protein
MTRRIAVNAGYDHDRVMISAWPKQAQEAAECGNSGAGGKAGAAIYDA